jgi:hypothetical protein
MHLAAAHRSTARPTPAERARPPQPHAGQRHAHNGPQLLRRRDRLTQARPTLRTPSTSNNVRAVFPLLLRDLPSRPAGPSMQLGTPAPSSTAVRRAVPFACSRHFRSCLWCRISPRRSALVVEFSNDLGAADVDVASGRGGRRLVRDPRWRLLQRSRLTRQPRLLATASLVP